jgi:dTDP-glucose 4,6-dehydratase
LANVDSLTYAGNINNLSSVNDNSRYSFFEGDICDERFINKILLKFQPEAIVHFAAESHVDNSIDNPLKFVETNVLGTSVLLNEALKYWTIKLNSNINAFRFIHVSTDEVYGSLGKTGLFNENTPYSPNSPYSASKAASDHLVNAWNTTYNLPIILTNCSNNYGPYQYPEKLIPLIITNCLQEKELPVYGDGMNVRDWIYVDDHCDALNSLLLDGKIGESYNIGGGNELKNIDLVNFICAELDIVKPRMNGSSYSELIKFVDDRAGHDFRYAINSSKLKDEIGWSQKQTFETGIRKTIQWYLKNESWWITHK